MDKVYAVKQIVLTIQGEGFWSGRLALFVRFSGCNVWSGREGDRQANAARGACALFCDTDFVGTDGENGGRYHCAALVAKIDRMFVDGNVPFPHRIVVFTGGEPSLQLDESLVDALNELGVRLHVETNGSAALPRGLDWITLSPKPPMPVVLREVDEVKVLVPEFDPLAFSHLVRSGGCRWVQPMDPAASNGSDAYDLSNTHLAVQFVREHPEWAVTLQQHKILGVP